MTFSNALHHCTGLLHIQLCSPFKLTFKRVQRTTDTTDKKHNRQKYRAEAKTQQTKNITETKTQQTKNTAETKIQQTSDNTERHHWPAPHSTLLSF